MNSLISVWAGLSNARRMIVVLATVAVFAAVLLLSRGIGNTDMALLFGNLENSSAGDVIGALEQQGVPYEVRGASIFVPAAQRDSLRLTLAASGLPTSGSQGYELLDGLSGFGTTSQMFDAAYWRAKEGELARTILASPHIRTARVHISAQTARPFGSDAMPTAAVTVGTVAGQLSTAQADALRHLVAASVTGLVPENVSVIDGQGGLISAGDDHLGATNGARVEQLRSQAQRILEARVGPGNAIVEVAVDLNTESETIVERRIEPDSRIAISTEIEERTSATQDSRGGDVTVASNIPVGDGAGGDGTSATDDSETRTVTNYELSETSREIQRVPGDIRRMTVAVLVNDVVDEAGAVEPRGEQELAALGALVGSAIGLDEARGDVLTIRSMPFEPIVPLGTLGVAEAGTGINMMSLIQLGVLAAVALILGLFVVRPILSSRAGAQLPAPANSAALAPPVTMMEENAAVGPVVDATAGSDPVTRLRSMIDDREQETIEILRSWVEEPTTQEQA